MSDQGDCRNQYGLATRVRKLTGTTAMNLHAQTRVVQVFSAGDFEHAKQVVRSFCSRIPCCVTVHECDFMYTGGEEKGVCVSFRNYPKFPSDAFQIRSTAFMLADELIQALNQRSYMVCDHGGMTTCRFVEVVTR